MKQFFKNFGAILYVLICTALYGWGIKALFVLFATLSTTWIVILSIIAGSFIATFCTFIAPLVVYPAKLLVKESTAGKVLCSISIFAIIVLYLIIGVNEAIDVYQINPSWYSKYLVLQIIGAIMFLIGAIISMVMLCVDYDKTV